MKVLALLFLLMPMASLAGTAKPPAHGHYTLIVAGSADQPMPGELFVNAEHGRQPARIQPFVVPGFTSFQACVAAGMEMQARFSSDGYALDFVCALVSP